LPYNIFTKLYDSIVWPVIAYGRAAIWGTTTYSSIKAVQHRAARFFLGVGKYTPNAAVNGDIGWIPPCVKQMKSVSNQWYRSVTMSTVRLHKRVFDWAKGKASNRYKNWHFRVCSKLNSIQVNGNAPDSKWTFCNEVECKLMIEWTGNWKAEVNREHSRTAGSNKLRHYKRFKNEFGVEDYVSIIHYNHRSAFAKFRCGVAPIRVETGRYEGLVRESRTCFHCKDVVEDEMHVLLVCPLYDVIRHSLIHEALFVFSDFNSLSVEQQFDILFGSKYLCRFTARICSDILAFRKKLIYLCD
jgi:hypothetical protein